MHVLMLGCKGLTVVVVVDPQVMPREIGFKIKISISTFHSKKV